MSNPPVHLDNNKSLKITRVHSNVDQELIEITTDKLSLILNNHIQNVSSRKEWLTPFSIFLTLVIVLCTADFKVKFGIPADTWNAIFILSCVISFIWLVVALIRMKRAVSINDILNTIKNIE